MAIASVGETSQGWRGVIFKMALLICAFQACAVKPRELEGYPLSSTFLS
jgi:hypothetical protein